jgi:hypothetical protein
MTENLCRNCDIPPELDDAVYRRISYGLWPLFKIKPIELEFGIAMWMIRVQHAQCCDGDTDVKVYLLTEPGKCIDIRDTDADIEVERPEYLGLFDGRLA